VVLAGIREHFYQPEPLTSEAPRLICVAVSDPSSAVSVDDQRRWNVLSRPRSPERRLSLTSTPPPSPIHPRLPLRARRRVDVKGTTANAALQKDQVSGGGERQYPCWQTDGMAAHNPKPWGQGFSGAPEGERWRDRERERERRRRRREISDFACLPWRTLMALSCLSARVIPSSHALFL